MAVNIKYWTATPWLGNETLKWMIFITCCNICGIHIHGKANHLRKGSRVRFRSHGFKTTPQLSALTLVSLHRDIPECNPYENAIFTPVPCVSSPAEILPVMIGLQLWPVCDSVWLVLSLVLTDGSLLNGLFVDHNCSCRTASENWRS